MTDHELEQALRAWYRGEVGADEVAPAELRQRLAAIPRTTPVPLRELPRGRGPMLLAAAALVLLGGAIAAGSGLLRQAPVVPPSPPVALIATPSPSSSDRPTPSATVIRDGDLIAYTRPVQRATSCSRNRTSCPVSRLWIARTDGSDARELVPDGTTGQTLVAWSPDGSHLLYIDEAAMYLIDPRGDAPPQQVDIGCPTRWTDPAPTCQASQVALSADGQRLVFVRTTTDDQAGVYPSTIATLDLQTGQVLDLSSTMPADGGRPGWSPDGTHIVFSQAGTKDTGGPIPPVKAGLFVVDADGQNLRQISPPTIDAIDGVWSPDGAHVVFRAPLDFPSSDRGDVYSIRPDGTDLRPLTTDGSSGSPTWTPDGRILFSRGSADGATDTPDAGWWTMAADGTDQRPLVRAAALEIPVTDLPYQQLAVQPLGGAAIVPPPWRPVAAAPVGPAPPTPSPTPIPDLAAGFRWAGTTTTSDGLPLGETATRLADGRVLLTQACGTGAGLFDPATGTVSPTGSMTATRASKTATLLPDGRVLIAGGYDCGRAGHDGIWASAELYDPATGTFSPTGSMTTPREMQTATLLADGRVLITGGITGAQPTAAGGMRLASIRTVDTSANVLATAEIYDPATGTFRKTGSMHAFRNDHTATLLQDGRVLVTGGGGEGYASRASAELFDPTNGTFTKTGSMKTGRWLHTATRLPDGRVLILGGRSPKDSVYRSAELYDPAAGTFRKAGSMTEGRQQHTATLLPDGRVFIAGGYWSDGQHWRVLSSTEMYDPATGAFTSIGSMGTRRDGHTATLLADGRVYIAGGADIGSEGGVGVTSAVLYEP